MYHYVNYCLYALGVFTGRFRRLYPVSAACSHLLRDGLYAGFLNNHPFLVEPSVAKSCGKSGRKLFNAWLEKTDSWKLCLIIG
ncbi:hypothetical protein D3C86_1902310 [compost metagenome]